MTPRSARVQPHRTVLFSDPGNRAPCLTETVWALASENGL